MAKKARKPLDLTLPIFQATIGLQHVDPPIWRRVLLSDCDLEELHEIIQIVMGWEDMHPHAFVIDGEDYGNLRHGGDFDYDSRFVRLSEVVENGHSRFQYDYDFGDDWKHLIEVEKTLPAEEGVRYPRCVEGERACPPEDSGGPYGYPDLLEKLQDPQHEEHEETLEWVGDGFDPEAFDLDAVNAELLRRRRWFGRRRGTHSPKAAFAKGELVQVKHGVVHDQYPDIPLGGWVAKIKRIGWLTPIGYAVHWTGPTLDQVPAIYVKRCLRDYLKPHRQWLEEDQLEAAAGEEPVAMERPTNIVTRPLSSDDPDDRVKMLFGLTSDDPLPKADQQSQRHYLDYLQAHLSFPFEAQYAAAPALGLDESEAVQVLAFAIPPIAPGDGIMCEGRKGAHGFQVPLALLQVREDDPNFQYVEDYNYWLWEVQDYEEAGEGPPPPQFPIGTIAYYGPDDKTTTKIAAGVIVAEGAEPILRRWVATDVVANPKVANEINQFFKEYGVKQVGMSEGNLGCPHEEGEDFPVGGDCPFCPWWKGKQGSGAGE